jgi:transposase
MAFREVGVLEIREVLRLWLRGRSARSIGHATGVHRETVGRYVEAARSAGCDPAGDEAQLTDELIARVVEAVRPARPGGRGATWELAQAHRAYIDQKLKAGVPLVKVRAQLRRDKGVQIPYATLHRFAAAELNFGRKQTTVRVADGDPGAELQVDFGRMGLVPDPATGRRRTVWALIFTACYSRHTFVFLTDRQTLERVIAGFEAAWAFFGGVFGVVIPDNLKAIVDTADPVNPKFTDAFVEYAQARGFEIDPARVRHPRDKPRVERAVSYVRRSFFAGEAFRDLDHAQQRAVAWCLDEAGLRVHGTTQRRPLEQFRAEEQARLRPAPTAPYDLPVWKHAKVHRDFHIECERALYSVPHTLVSERVTVRADARWVKVFHRGRLVKTHPRTHPGGRQTDAADYPDEKRAYATRDLDYLRRVAVTHGRHVGAYAVRLLDTPLPWTKMRQVYRLLNLVKKFGAARTDEACRQALELDVVDVTRIARMLERGAAAPVLEMAGASAPVGELRFARSPAAFAVERGGGS